MTEQLKLDSPSLEAATESLRAAACTIEGARGGTAFTFESLSGVARAASGFLRRVEAAAEQLSELSRSGAQSLVLLGSAASTQEHHLANSLGGGFVAVDGVTSR